MRDYLVLRYLSADKHPFSLLLELRLLGIVRDVCYTDMDRDGDQWTAAVAAQFVKPPMSRFEVASADSKKLAKRLAAKELIKFFIKNFDKVDPPSSLKTSSVTSTTSLESTLSSLSISSTSLTSQPLCPTIPTLIKTTDFLQQLHSTKSQLNFSGDERPMKKPKEVGSQRSLEKVSNVFAIIEDEGEEPCAAILDMDIGEEVGEKHDI